MNKEQVDVLLDDLNLAAVRLKNNGNQRKEQRAKICAMREKLGLQ